MFHELKKVRAAVGIASVTAVLAMLCGCGGGDNDTTLVNGETQQVAGRSVTTWAQVGPNNMVQEVGVTVPADLIQNPPAQAGAGPAGALVTPAFPAVVQNTTFFNHFELQWEPNGHPPAVYSVPHFDFHFYGVPVAQVQAVTAPDTAVPDASRIPAGYTYPGVNAVVPQMGAHASPDADFAPGAPAFTKTLIFGYYGGNLTFLEPMITQAFLNQRQNFTIAVPRPAALGRNTLYPTLLTVTYNAGTNSYDLVFSNFVSVQ
ncbi:MAG TPA: hypothetical protein VFB38_00025 [Chthonomonadaceae bacterium]|nr:hypothetical protein [Chthonomonadaceae bacterium]